MQKDTMISEILCVGTEILLGDIVNTNAAFISNQLANLGIDVFYQTVVGDNPGRLKEAIDIAFSRADLVIMTGGLGPTYDDLTKETVAKYFDKKMYMHEESLAYIEKFFSSRNLPMTENNKKQAMMPEGATVFPNEYGTAPALAVEGKGKTAVLLPGPPSEMKPLFLEQVRPYLMERTGRTIVSHSLHLMGIGESAVEDMLREMMEAYQNPSIAPYAKEGEVRLRITASAENTEKAEALIAPVLEELKGILSEYVYGIDVGEVENAAVSILKEKGLTVAIAESCTGGLVSKRVTDIAGVSDIFTLSMCTYANEMKEKCLGVQHDTLVNYGAVSEQCAAEMAEGIRKVAGTDIGVSVTGIAGPTGGTEEKPVGTVYIGVSSKGLTKVFYKKFGSGRKNQRAYTRNVAAKNTLLALLQAAINN